MCTVMSPPIGHVRIMRCAHGTNFITLGRMTIHLNDSELALLDRAVHALSEREPLLRQALAAACGSDSDVIADGDSL